MACPLLPPRAMATFRKQQTEAWTVPLHVIMWATIGVGFLMALVLLMLH
jgi:hypothetical protein